MLNPYNKEPTFSYQGNASTACRSETWA